MEVNGYKIEPGAQLAGANLSNAKLLGVNLERANLVGADLSNAKLAGANLFCADLSRANLCGADLSGANLYGANLEDANLAYAVLAGANLDYWEDLEFPLSESNINDFENLEVDQPRQDIFLSPFEIPRRSANLTGANLKGTTMPDGTVH
jgi:uncharacterized protein YjbI with pentapeptide repeats